MKISVDNIAAKCPKCGAGDFEAIVLRADQTVDTVACNRCGAKMAHTELIVQIGDEAVRQAKESLAALKKKARDLPPAKARKG